MDCKVAYKPYKKPLDSVRGLATPANISKGVGIKSAFEKVYSGYGKDSSSGRSETQSQAGGRHCSRGLISEVRVIALMSAGIGSFLQTALTSLCSDVPCPLQTLGVGTSLLQIDVKVAKLTSFNSN